ncbi:MAG: SDR family NAD(P)-dependent oxidoreductase, partial [Planctomycetaceae bacterium]|nr:SDR family NAD(P)-dependent oxidoreductase [Planctomycetaceae bacterium]
MSRFEQRVGLVTGAASGIGAAVSRALVSEGARVVLADVDRAGAERLARELGQGA